MSVFIEGEERAMDVESTVHFLSAAKYTKISLLQAAFETYHLMSEKWFIHASPTLFHAGTSHPQLSSCFLLPAKEDSIVGIYDTLKQVPPSRALGIRPQTVSRKNARD